MIIIRLNGGIGNQMFQYAMGRSLSVKNNTDLFLDIEEYDENNFRRYELDKFRINARIATKREIASIKPNKILNFIDRFKHFSKRRYLKERQFNFDKEVLEAGDNIYIDGYFQDEKYFKDIEDNIKKEFTLKDEVTEATAEWIKKAEGCDSISLHIRRGDYAQNKKTNQFHGTCGIDYYEKAIKIVSEKIKDSNFFIFSDDIAWAKNNLKLNFPAYFVSDGNISDYEELIIMSRCKHNIIANSSFSWWGAWLNDNPKKIVIAPQKWFATDKFNTENLIPEKWTSLQ